MRPSPSISRSATTTVRSASMVTSVAPRSASAATDSGAAVGGAGIRGHEQGHVVVRLSAVERDFQRYPLEKWRGTALLGQIRGDVEHHRIRAWLKLSSTQVG